MTDTPGTRIETDLDRIRREAFQKEAAALREAALEHFKEQTSPSLEGLKSAVRSEMTAAVKQALADQGVKEALRQELVDQVKKVAADLARQIEGQIKKEVAKEVGRVAEGWFTEKLKALTKTSRPVPVDEDRVKEKRPLDQEDDGGPSDPNVDHSTVPTAPAQSWWERLVLNNAALASIITGLFLIAALVLWKLLGPPALEDDIPDRSPTPVPTETISAPPPAELSVAAQRIRTDWIKVVTTAERQLSADSPLPRLYMEHQPNSQFACWFTDDAQKKLERLARGSSSEEVQEELERVFESCFSDQPRLRDPMLAVFSAQSVVAAVFTRFRPEWDSWCAISTETMPPIISMDGFPGPATFDGMNTFLECTGHGGELTVGANSTTPQYLYITYLALRELQR